MVRTTNKSCLNSIAVYEPGDPGHSMGEDCVRVGGFLWWGIISVLGTLPSSCVPAGGFPDKEGTGGGCNGKGRSWSLAAGTPLGQRQVGASAAVLGQWFQWFCC